MKKVDKTAVLTNEFVKKMNLNSPINGQYKYAYKPFLLISILNNVREKDLFQKEIKINTEIAKTFYDLNTENDDYFNSLINAGPKKKEWEIGFNEGLAKQIVALIIKMPAEKLVCDGWILNKKSKSITLNFDPEDKEEFINFLKNECLKTIKKCIPEYKDIKIKDLINEKNYDNYYQKLIQDSNIDSDTKVRKYQHIFRKKVLDRDKKCLVCGIETNYLLEAAHIKPYSMCKGNEHDKYSTDNGIALCKNHHKMFDANDFIFDLEGHIKFSKIFNQNDKKILFRDYGKTVNIINEYNKQYFLFRNENIRNKSID